MPPLFPPPFAAARLIGSAKTIAAMSADLESRFMVASGFLTGVV